MQCWGSNLFSESTPPAEVSFTRLASGFSFACGLTSDETLDCWGANKDGRSSPPSGKFIAVMAGGEIAGGHACAIDMEGKLICWGFAGEQEDRTTPPKGTFKQVSGGAFHNCALKTDNTAACWGANDTLQATPPAGTFRLVSAGRSHSCGLRTDGSVACWGWNAEGQTDVPAELLL